MELEFDSAQPQLVLSKKLFTSVFGSTRRLPLPLVVYLSYIDNPVIKYVSYLMHTQHPCWGLSLSVSIKVFAKTLLLLLTGKGDGVLGDKYGTVWLSGRTGVLGELVKVVCRLLMC